MRARSRKSKFYSLHAREPRQAPRLMSEYRSHFPSAANIR
jgi:hypothetical protein